jgi:hypothetical protein
MTTLDQKQTSLYLFRISAIYNRHTFIRHNKILLHGGLCRKWEFTCNVYIYLQ